MFDPNGAPRSTSTNGWPTAMKRHLLALITGLGCGLISLLILAATQRADYPYTNYVAQEFATDDPDAGFEGTVGYAGSQNFYWDELIESRRYKLAVIEAMGQSPESKLGLIATAYADRRPPWITPGENGLFLVLVWPMADSALSTIDEALAAELSHHSSAFVAEAKDRGVDVQPVGKPIFFSEDHGSFKELVRRRVTSILGASVFSALIVCFIGNQHLNQTAKPRPDSIPGD